MPNELKQHEHTKPEQEFTQATYTRRPAPTAYIDYAAVTSSYYGFKLSFATVIQTSPEPLIEEFASVGMSAEHAKELHRALSSQLKQFEERWGAIRPKPTEPHAGVTATGTGNPGDSDEG